MNGDLKPVLGSKIQMGHPLAQGLVACYLMNEGSGSPIRDSVSGLVGTPTGSGVSWKPGKFGSCIYNDGVNDGILATTPPNLLVATPKTIVMWVNMVSLSTDVMLLDMNDRNNLRIATIGNDSYTHRITVTGFGVQAACKWSSILLVNTWYQICCVFDPSIRTDYTPLIYVNGVDTTATPDFYWNAGSGVSKMTITERFSAGSEMNGSMDHLLIYNRALRSNEVTKLYLDPFCMFEEEV